MTDTHVMLPKHIGIIMDGNGRWAAARGEKRSYGHREGVKTLRNIIKHCGDLGVTCVTVYAFSTENFKRSKEEVDGLMSLLLEFLHKDTATIMANGVQIRVIGNMDGFPKAVTKEIRRVVRESKNGKNMVLNIALGYGARAEITDAVKEIAQRVSKGKLAVEDITEQTISAQLYTAGLPDPDLIIRTSGELRLSNFMLYQGAYSELYFTDVFWPDFTPAELDKAIEEYQSRNRRFGGA